MKLEEEETAIVLKAFARECRRAVLAHSSALSPSDHRLLQQVVGPGGDEAGYLYGGLTTSMGIRAVLRLLGKRIADFDRILDFGCGSARVLRWFQDVQNKTELYGCDINPDAIDWSKKNIHFAKFVLNEKLPPLP